MSKNKERQIQLQATLHKKRGNEDATAYTVVGIGFFIAGFGIEYAWNLVTKEYTGYAFGIGTVLCIIMLLVGKFIKKSYTQQADNFVEYKKRQKELKKQRQTHVGE